MAAVASLDFENMSVLQGIVGSIALGILLWNRRMMIFKGLQIASRTIAGLYNTLLGTRIGLQTASNRKAGFGLMKSAGDFVMNMFNAGAQAPPPSNLVLPFVMGAIGGAIAGALLAAFMLGDDVVAPGYGKRILSTPEGSIALNNKDTVIAGTNLFKADDVSLNPEGSMDVVGPSADQMAAAFSEAASNIEIRPQMKYDSFGARNTRGSVVYSRQTGKGKFA